MLRGMRKKGTTILLRIDKWINLLSTMSSSDDTVQAGAGKRGRERASTCASDHHRGIDVYIYDTAEAADGIFSRPSKHHRKPHKTESSAVEEAPVGLRGIYMQEFRFDSAARR